MLMLGTVAGKGLDLTGVSSDWNLESEDMVAGHEVGEEVGADVGSGSCSVYEQLYLLEESWLLLRFIRFDLDSLDILCWENMTGIRIDLSNSAHGVERLFWRSIGGEISFHTDWLWLQEIESLVHCESCCWSHR